MKLRLLIMGFAVACIANACKPATEENHQSQVIALEKEVLAIHDEVMPRMSEIEELKTTLEAELMNSSLDSSYIRAVQESIAALEAGDSLMWDWMHNFSKPENVSEDSMMTFMTNEKEKISNVSVSMKNAISSAQGLLKKLGHAQPH
jgi:hypothetical protein